MTPSEYIEQKREELVAAHKKEFNGNQAENVGMAEDRRKAAENAPVRPTYSTYGTDRRDPKIQTEQDAHIALETAEQRIAKLSGLQVPPTNPASMGALREILVDAWNAHVDTAPSVELIAELRGNLHPETLKARSIQLELEQRARAARDSAWPEPKDVDGNPHKRIGTDKGPKDKKETSFSA